MIRVNALLFLIVVCLCFLTSNTSLAQLKKVPVQRIEASPTNTSSNHARIKAGEPLTLPFWDDFSFTPTDSRYDSNANFPLDSIWMHSKSVWINDGMGINSPTRNVATFDGLDSLGLPYSDVQLATGFCDKLISQPINLSESSVPLNERPFVWMSFKYQWKGNGEAPDRNDFLRLSFKELDGQWTIMADIYPKASYDHTVFYDTIIQVNKVQFFHDAFQFKFENRGRKTGPFDTWNLDYIYLDKGRTLTDKAFPDRAIGSGLTQLFGNYYAVPIRHVSIDSALRAPTFSIQNMDDEILNAIGYDASVDVVHYHAGAETSSNATLVSGGSTSVIFPNPYQRFTQHIDVLPDLSDLNLFDAEADSISMTLRATLRSGDNVDPERDRYAPIDFTINDTVSVQYTLQDYYAYDDGTAEFSAVNTQAGDRFVFAFDMLTPDPDTLIGFYAYFPPFALNTSNRQINIYIYKDNNGFPQEDPYYAIPFFTVERKGVNEFQYITIGEPFVVQKRFYIGYESVTVPIGIDISNDANGKIFERVNSVWLPNTEVKGSIMIRPRFGNGNGAGGPITGLPEPESFTLYPNPMYGAFNLRGDATLLRLYNAVGQQIAYHTESHGKETRIILHDATPGLYVAHIQHQNKIISYKIFCRQP